VLLLIYCFENLNLQVAYSRPISDKCQQIDTSAASVPCMCYIIPEVSNLVTVTLIVCSWSYDGTLTLF